MSIKFGVIGSGRIAHVIVNAIKDASGAEVVAISSRNVESATKFAAEHNIGRIFKTWKDMIISDEIDAVYVATPTIIREEICIKAAKHKKHVLAEKPFLSLASLQKITTACLENKVAFMDGTHFVHHPRTHKIKQELKQRIGCLRGVRANFFFPLMHELRNNLRFDPLKEPSGAIGDMAWYCMRATIEFMMDESCVDVDNAMSILQKEPTTNSIIRGDGVIKFMNNCTSVWSAGYNAGSLLMSLELMGDQGVITLDDYVFDWAGGTPFSHSDHKVGFSQYVGVLLPEEFQWISTPCKKRASVLMIENFVGLTQNPMGEIASNQIETSLRTQCLVDTIWQAG